MTDYKKLIDALLTIQNECEKYDDCEYCPFSTDIPFADNTLPHKCGITAKLPNHWKIKTPSVIRLLESE
jgi:hypothetical protein|nr:MAG TPA: hypothetical protein [Caudoviricetes sp.]